MGAQIIKNPALVAGFSFFVSIEHFDDSPLPVFFRARKLTLPHRKIAVRIRVLWVPRYLLSNLAMSKLAAGSRTVRLVCLLFKRFHPRFQDFDVAPELWKSRDMCKLSPRLAYRSRWITPYGFARRHVLADATCGRHGCTLADLNMIRDTRLPRQYRSLADFYGA